MKKAYEFLVKAENNSTLFTIDDLVAASGWTLKTAQGIKSKKISQFLQKVNNKYKCVGISRLSEIAFCRLCSQTSTLAKDPEKPILLPEIEGLVIKARDAALAAVQHYNNPTSLFRSDNYIILMIIAFTSLFHAILKRDGVYIEDTTHVGRNGKFYLWDVEKCCNYYLSNYISKLSKVDLESMEQNIKFMIPIRNDIEHQFIPELDPFIIGHCQSMLMNFEKLLVEEFTNYYALNASLSIALQFSTNLSAEAANSLKRFESAEFQELKKYISEFHKSLRSEIYTNPNFAFRIWLIPKTGNHQNSSDLAVEFINIDKLDPEKAAQLESDIIAIKDKNFEVPKDPGHTHPYLFSEVIKKVNEIIGKQIIGQHDIQIIIKMYKVKENPKYYFRASIRTAPGQYSNSFVHWLVEQYKTDADFFTKARQIYKSKKD